MSNNRQRVSIPVLGIDTSTTDTQIKDGAMQELHNLRYSGGAWRDIKPFLEKNSALLLKFPNRITISEDGHVTAELPVSQNVQVEAIWEDIDGLHRTSTFTEVTKGTSSAKIDVAYDILVGASVTSDYDDPDHAFYTQFDEVPQIPLRTDITPDTIVGVYQHPADDDNAYLLIVRSDDGKTIYRTKIEDGYLTILQHIDFYSTDFELTHLGKVLIILDRSNSNVLYYYLKDDKYNLFILPSAPIVRQAKKLSTNKSESFPNNEYSYIEPFDSYTEESFGTNIHAVKLYSRESNIFALPTFHRNNTFWGEICYFAVFETEDGKLIAPSALNISASEPFAHGKDGMTFYKGLSYEATKFNIPTLFGDDDIVIKDFRANENLDHVFPWSFAISPRITISIDPNIDRTMFASVKIFSTRVHPIWDINKLKSLSDRRVSSLNYTHLIDLFWFDYWVSANDLFADNNLPEQPFYAMKDIPLSEFNADGLYSMWITADLLKNIEHKTVYQPVEAHRLYFSSAKEYNRRLHSSGKLTTKLHEGFASAWMQDSEVTTSASTELLIDDTLYYARSAPATALSTAFIANKILSYPDYRATSIYSPSSYESVKFALKSAIENNFAYAINTISYGEESDFYDDGESVGDQSLLCRRIVKYSSYFAEIGLKTIYNEDDFIGKDVVTRSNVMRVSAANNPFVFPLTNSYAIGTEANEIIAVNSAAIEISDDKIGQFPLYVFTKEGIYVMQLGSGEVLYDFDLPRFYDQIINPHTLAVNKSLLYITARGLHALNSNGTSLISEALNDEFNAPNIDFWKSASLSLHPKYNEVIAYSESKDEQDNVIWPHAFVFSLDNQTWSTRDWYYANTKSQYQINTGDIVSIDNAMHILDTNEEARSYDQTTTVHLISRPIKFGSMEFKRIETLIPRIEVDAAQPLRITIEASSDLVSWVTLREISTLTSNHTLTIRRTSCSARYFRIAMEVNVTHNFALSGFDMEYYLRFLHRLR